MYTLYGVILTLTLTIVTSQRPPYVPEPVRYPDVAPRFRQPEPTTVAAVPVNLNNRAGAPDATTTTTTTMRLPLDARGNVDVVNQINQWPEDRRPFWYVNQAAIEASRANPQPGAGGTQLNQLNLAQRSSFLPGGNTN